MTENCLDYLSSRVSDSNFRLASVSTTAQGTPNSFEFTYFTNVRRPFLHLMIKFRNALNLEALNRMPRTFTQSHQGQSGRYSTANDRLFLFSREKVKSVGLCIE